VEEVTDTDHGNGENPKPAMSAITVVLMADRSDLVRQFAEIQWRQWKNEPGGEHLVAWIDGNRLHTGRETLPVGFLAVDDQDQVLGGVSLVPVQHDELRDRGPWVQGMIVRPDARGKGVGALLLHSLETWAVEHRIARLWLCNDGPAVAFYQRHGWISADVVVFTGGIQVTVLTKETAERRAP
jgi:GNAT superfamily N-acetyltransferase